MALAFRELFDCAFNLQAWLAIGSRYKFDEAIDLKRTITALLHGKATCP